MANLTLKEKDLRTTTRREAILAVITEFDRPVTAEDIFVAVLQREHMSLSTIYRALGALTEKEILLKNAGQDGKTYYQMNTHRHKHYLRCTGCNEIVPLNDCPLRALEKDLSEKTGYLITGHSLELTGLCPKCASKKSNPPRY